MDNMFTELSNEYDTMSNYIRRIDVQLGKTVESVKRQQGTLFGKFHKNPSAEHYNAIELGCDTTRKNRFDSTRV